jgi:hypothetical protein
MQHEGHEHASPGVQGGPPEIAKELAGFWAVSGVVIRSLQSSRQDINNTGLHACLTFPITV